MSCGGGNYVVPGADPCNGGGGGGGGQVTVTAGYGVIVNTTNIGGITNYIINAYGTPATFSFPLNTQSGQFLNRLTGPIPLYAGGGDPVSFAPMPILPANFDVAKNPQVTVTLTMAGNAFFNTSNEFAIGLFDNTNVPICAYSTGGIVPAPIQFNWGDLIPEPANVIITTIVPGSRLLMNPFYGAFMSFQDGFGAPYQINNVIFSLKIDYFV
jgi:hypothetical protein